MESGILRLILLVVGAGVILGILTLAGIYLVLNASGFVGPMVSRRFRRWSPSTGTRSRMSFDA